MKPDYKTEALILNDANLKRLVLIDAKNFTQESSKIILQDRNPDVMITRKQKPKVC